MQRLKTRRLLLFIKKGAVKVVQSKMPKLSKECGFCRWIKEVREAK